MTKADEFATLEGHKELEKRIEDLEAVVKILVDGLVGLGARFAPLDGNLIDRNPEPEEDYVNTDPLIGVFRVLPMSTPDEYAIQAMILPGTDPLKIGEPTYPNELIVSIHESGYMYLLGDWHPRKKKWIKPMNQQKGSVNMNIVNAAKKLAK